MKGIIKSLASVRLSDSGQFLFDFDENLHTGSGPEWQDRVRSESESDDPFSLFCHNSFTT